jgi:Zn finger protein HypA/HybF involved in hydrogenase expression
MMELPFKCKKCDHEFEAIDEHYVNCPKCEDNNVVVDWEKTR